MNVLLSNEITASMLVSSNAPKRLDGQLEWSAIAYSPGAVVTRTVTGRVYRAVYSVPSGGVPPEQNIAVAKLPYWLDIGPMNRVAMFDKVMRTQTVGPAAGDLVIVIRPGSITDIWLSNITNATAASVSVKDKPDGTVIYAQTYSLTEKVTTYWDWYFSPVTQATEMPFTGIPAYRNCEVTITLHTTGQASLGMAALGMTESFGCTVWGVDSDFQRYTPRSGNSDWGPTEQGGEVTKDVAYQIYVQPDDAPRVDLLTKKAMKRLAVYIPSNQPKFSGIRIFGEMISARLGYPSPGYVPLDITIREFL